MSINKGNLLLGNYKLLWKIDKRKLKFKNKPRITAGLLKSISVKILFLTDFIKKKDPAKKLSFFQSIKQGHLTIPSKQIKQNYYEHFFESNWNTVKNTLKGIKWLITLQNMTRLVPRAISQGEITIDNIMILLTSIATTFSYCWK